MAKTARPSAGGKRGSRRSSGKNDAKRSARERLDNVIDRLQRALESEDVPSKGTIDSLAALMRLRREANGGDEKPAEIRVIWHETEEESSKGE